MSLRVAYRRVMGLIALRLFTKFLGRPLCGAVVAFDTPSTSLSATGIQGQVQWWISRSDPPKRSDRLLRNPSTNPASFSSHGTRELGVWYGCARP
jgi:hypothetical protein